MDEAVFALAVPSRLLSADFRKTQLFRHFQRKFDRVDAAVR